MSPASRHARRAPSPSAILAALLSALLLFAVEAVAPPQPAAAATTMATACGTNLRTSASLSGRVRTTLPANVRVTVVATVTGGAWQATCAGRSHAGSKWYRISAINGRSVRSLYGVSYLYGATGLFKKVQASTTTTTRTLEAACAANLRTSASLSGRLRRTITTGTKVTVVATVAGGSWRAVCAGRSVSGSQWHRISAIAGQSVRSLYGVSYLYAATGLFRTVAAPAPAPTPEPPPITSQYAACDTNIRTAASLSGTRKATIAAGTEVGVASTVSGGSWSATCAGRSVSGSSWIRIVSIAGQSVKARFGVDALFAASGLFTTTRPSTEPPPPALTEGIDVSHWQGTIDWAKVAAAGKRFAFIKASENTSFVDSRYATNRAQAKAAGLFVGAYHFARPELTAGDAVREADHFLATAKPVRGELLPVLDLEVTGGLSPTQLQSWAKSYLGRIYERTGVRGILYVSPAFWRNHMGDTSWFAENGYRILWIAHWTTASSPTSAGSDWGGNGWTFWQYSSSGTVPGISGRVDLNRYNGSDFAGVLIP